MIFRQLSEPESSTYTYLIGCPETGRCLLVDPVIETAERDLAVIQELGLNLEMTLETHIQADHVSSAGRLRALTGCKVAYPAMEALACADIGICEDEPVLVGSIALRPIFTPGHTDTHYSYFLDAGGLPRLFTGDALLFDGCGRTDFQNGSTETLHHSVRTKIFSLSDDTLIYPAHDYQHRHVSTVAQERERNPRLSDGVSLEEFIEVMATLDLPYPKKIEAAVPANLRCGESPVDASELCGKSKQG